MLELPAIGSTPRPLAMPDDCKVDSVVESYRNYYRLHKREISRWPDAEIPEWFKEGSND